MSDSRWPDDGRAWPEHEDTPPIESADPRTAFNGSAWDPKLHGERRRPTTAEQAVPWLIGIVLALAGIVIVLLALIFTAPEGLLGTTTSPSPTPSAVAARSGSASASARPQATRSGAAEASVQPTRSPDRTPSAEPTPTPTPAPAPEYGPLEMVYLGRPSGLAPVYLLRRDFSKREEPRIMARADIGVANYAWSPDGTVGAAIIGQRLVAIRPGGSPRALIDGISAVTFGADASTLYAVRIAQQGGDDVAQVLAIDFRDGDTRRLASMRYPRPAIGPEAPLREAQFIDDGGIVRIYAMADGNLAVWVLGAPATYHVNVGDGTVTEARRQPVLWSPDGSWRIDLEERANGRTAMTLRNSGGEPVARTTASGLVSHVRWVRSSNEIVFTLGQQNAGGGVRQDLHVWDLRDGRAPMPLTSNGASFGAEWLGSAPNWQP